jgi:hypothetical protein
MAVYVDDACIPATVPNGRTRHTSNWSHLFADSQEELHAFASRLGLRRSYFQPGKRRGDGSPSPHWHYDVTSGKRMRAIQLGAHPVTWRDAVRIIREREARAERAHLADQASRAAWTAYTAHDFSKAIGLLQAARAADPSRADLWAGRIARVRVAARAQRLAATQQAGDGAARTCPARRPVRVANPGQMCGGSGPGSAGGADEPAAR